MTPDEALLILKIAHVHKTPGLLGKLSCLLTASLESAHFALEILQQIPVHNAGAKSAHQLYQKELDARKIITFCGDLDGMLGGGVATGQITEFCKHFLTANNAAMTVTCILNCKADQDCGSDAQVVSQL